MSTNRNNIDNNIEQFGEDNSLLQNDFQDDDYLLNTILSGNEIEPLRNNESSELNEVELSYLQNLHENTLNIEIKQKLTELIKQENENEIATLLTNNPTLVNYLQANDDDNTPITFDNLLKLLLVLSKRRLRKVQTLLLKINKNSLIVFFSQGEINLNTKSHPDYRIFSESYLLKHFKVVYSSGNDEVIKDIWNNCKNLQVYIRELDKQDDKIDLLNFFQDTLACQRCNGLSKEIWDNCPNFQAYIINLDNPALLALFRNVLASKYPDVFKEFWTKTESKLLPHINTLSEINYKDLLYSFLSNIRTMTTEFCIEFMQNHIDAKYVHLLAKIKNEIKDNNKKPRNPFINEKLRVLKTSINYLSASHVSALQNIPIEVYDDLANQTELNPVKNLYQSANEEVEDIAIKQKLTELIEAIKQEKEKEIATRITANPTLANYLKANDDDNGLITFDNLLKLLLVLSKKRRLYNIQTALLQINKNILITFFSQAEINLNTKSHPDYRIFSESHLLNYFKVVLNSQNSVMIEDIWSNCNNLLVYIRELDKQDDKQDLLNFFKKTLSCQKCNGLSKEIWDNCPNFQAYIIKLDNPAFLKLFRTVLASKYPDIFKEFWTKTKIKFMLYINTLSEKKYKKLLYSFLSNIRTMTTEFCIEFMQNHIDAKYVHLLAKIKNEIKDKNEKSANDKLRVLETSINYRSEHHASALQDAAIEVVYDHFPNQTELNGKDKFYIDDATYQTNHLDTKRNSNNKKLFGFEVYKDIMNDHYRVELINTALYLTRFFGDGIGVNTLMEATLNTTVTANTTAVKRKRLGTTRPSKPNKRARIALDKFDHLPNKTELDSILEKRGDHVFYLTNNSVTKNELDPKKNKINMENHGFTIVKAPRKQPYHKVTILNEKTYLNFADGKTLSLNNTVVDSTVQSTTTTTTTTTTSISDISSNITILPTNVSLSPAEINVNVDSLQPNNGFQDDDHLFNGILFGGEIEPCQNNELFVATSQQMLVDKNQNNVSTIRNNPVCGVVTETALTEENSTTAVATHTNTTTVNSRKRSRTPTPSSQPNKRVRGAGLEKFNHLPNEKELTRIKEKRSQCVFYLAKSIVSEKELNTKENKKKYSLKITTSNLNNLYHKVEILNEKKYLNFVNSKTLSSNNTVACSTVQSTTTSSAEIIVNANTSQSSKNNSDLENIHMESGETSSNSQEIEQNSQIHIQDQNIDSELYKLIEATNQFIEDIDKPQVPSSSEQMVIETNQNNMSIVRNNPNQPSTLTTSHTSLSLFALPTNNISLRNTDQGTSQNAPQTTPNSSNSTTSHFSPSPLRTNGF